RRRTADSRKELRGRRETQVAVTVHAREARVVREHGAHCRSVAGGHRLEKRIDDVAHRLLLAGVLRARGYGQTEQEDQRGWQGSPDDCHGTFSSHKGDAQVSRPRRGDTLADGQPLRAQRTSRSSISKTSVAFGGMTPPAPRGPYARCDGMTRRRCPPGCMPTSPSSHPSITRPAPTFTSNGSRSRLESNAVPSGR